MRVNENLISTSVWNCVFCDFNCLKTAEMNSECISEENKILKVKINYIVLHNETVHF